MANLTEKYVASMILSGVGDALGFRNGRWEFCQSGPIIHKELKDLGGLEKILVAFPKWKVSDDTIMHLATAEALMERGVDPDPEALYCAIAKHYKWSMNDMSGRSPGMTCSNGSWALKPDEPNGCHLPFNPRGGGCGAAMRAMCIGLRYANDLDHLIAVSCESGRMTHHHPTAYLGALAAALFTSYSIQNKPLHEWGAGLTETLGKAKEYIKSQNRFVDENLRAWSYFYDKWAQYLKKRNLTDGKSQPSFPKDYGVSARDAYYKTLSYDGWGGASGHDAPMIAYDALLGCDGSWSELCNRGMFHYGDSDSTGVIAAACYGAMFGFKGVPELNYKHLKKKKVPTATLR